MNVYEFLLGHIQCRLGCMWPFGQGLGKLDLGKGIPGRRNSQGP